MTKQKMDSQSGISKEKPNNENNTRKFIDGSTRSFASLRTATIGFGTYEPGWKWSLHAGPQTEKDSENHIGYVISGQMMVKDPSGNEALVNPGEAFEIVAGSDAWVNGDENCIALDFIPTK